MILVAITALLAVCGAAKLDRTYLPPPSAGSAGGSPDSLQTPFSRSSPGQGEPSISLPTGSYNNDFQGVVVDAASAGTRASSDGDQSALGGPRDSYGSSNSKVGDAAFRGSVAGFRNTPTFGSSGLNGQVSGVNAGQNFGSFESKSERPQASKDRNSNIITYANDVSSDNYSYGFESDNGIAVGENGVANNGIQAQGGYSYKGDDGQVYKVTYVADEGGYRPQGAHLPTPPPIPKEILESLEQNAKEEAAGLVDDGSYDAHKYNAEGDYTHHNGDNIQYNSPQLTQFAKRPESDAAASGTFINQNSEAFGKPGQLGNTGAQNTHSHFNGQSHQFNENQFGSNFANNQNSLAGSQDSQSSQTLSGPHGSSSTGHNSIGHFGQNSGNHFAPQFGHQPQGAFGGHSSPHGSQNGQQGLINQFGTQSPQFDSQANQQGSGPQFGGQSSQFGIQSNKDPQFGGQPNQVGSSSQFGAQPNKPSLGQDSNSALNSQSSQGTQFGNLGFKPQGSFGSTIPAQHGFDKQSQYNGDKQGQSQFGIAGLNKPSFGSFGSNKPSALGQTQNPTATSAVNNNENRFPNAPNQLGAEYLPPFNSNNKPSYNNPQINKAPTSQDSNKVDQTPNFVPLDGQSQGAPDSSSASAFASVGPTGFEPQPAKPLNAFQTQPSRPNQFNYYNNNQLTSQGQIGSNALPTSQHGGSHAVPGLAASEIQTATPATELTTPLEPNKKPDFTQGSQFNSQSSPSFGNFGSKPISQVQPQVGSQSNVAATQQSTGQTLTPSFIDSRPQASFQYGSSSPTQTAFSATQEQKPQISNQHKPQFPQNSFAQNQQNNGFYSTQKPSFSQGSDDSYYYNQPSKPFGTPAAGSQGSRFPSSPSYQSNGLTATQNSQFSNQQGLGTTKFPSSQSVAPTPSSQFTQTQGNPSTNYYNGITQASISPFPSASPTSSTLSQTTLGNQFGSKPTSNQPFLASQTQQNRPTISQQHSAVPSFPSKPTTPSGQSTSFTQNQLQFGQSLTNNNNQPSAVQSSPSKPTTAFGQAPSTLFNQNQNEPGQSSLSTNNEPQTPEENQEQQTISTQQYQGTVYEYNKPAEVLPASAQPDSSSSQSVQTDLSSKPLESQKPNYQESKPQLGQNTFLSQSQASGFNQGTKPQYGTQSFKPFGSLPSSNTQIGQNTQSTLSQTSFQQNSQGGVQPVKPNESTLVQFGQNPQAGLDSRPQFVAQPAKPFGSVSGPSHYGHNTQQILGASQPSEFTSSHQAQGSQSGIQQFGPVGGAPTSTNQFGQNTQTSLGSVTSPENSGSQFNAQPNKPFGSASNPSHFGNTPQTQGQHNSQSSQIGAQSYKPFGNAGSTQGAQLNKPFGTTGTNQGFQGYPSSKPQFGSQLNFPQTTQQTFGATQVSSKPTSGAQADALPFGNAPSIHGSPESQKPQFGQNTNLNQGTQPSGSSFGQQSFQSSQFSSSGSKPQFGQTQFGQNQNASPIKPFGSASSQAQFGQSLGQIATSGSQQQPSNAQAYKPFGGSSTHGSSFQSQNKPQFDQAPQSSLGASSTSSPPYAQPFKPFGSSAAQGSQNNNQSPENKPFGSQQASPCCQGTSQESSIGPLNVGKPSQAFAQTQSQFTGFQGAQSLNAQSVAGKGEEFGGPRQPPSFNDQTGYHY